MPKKAGKGKPDPSQRTLHHFHAFRQPQTTSKLSPCKDKKYPGLHSSAANSSHNVGSAGMDPQPLASHIAIESAPQVHQEQELMLPAVGIQGPHDCRKVACLQLNRQMSKLNSEQKGTQCRDPTHVLDERVRSAVQVKTESLSELWHVWCKLVQSGTTLMVHSSTSAL